MCNPELLTIAGNVSGSFGILLVVVSYYYNSKVMGDASLGVAVWAGEEDSPYMKNKRELRKMSDLFFYFGVGFSLLGIILNSLRIII